MITDLKLKHPSYYLHFYFITVLLAMNTKWRKFSTVRNILTDFSDDLLSAVLTDGLSQSNDHILTRRFLRQATHHPHRSIYPYFELHQARRGESLLNTAAEPTEQSPGLSSPQHDRASRALQLQRESRSISEQDDDNNNYTF